MAHWGELKCPNCAVLEAKVRKSALQEIAALGQASEAYQAQLAAEAKLAQQDALIKERSDEVQAAVAAALREAADVAEHFYKKGQVTKPEDVLALIGGDCRYYWPVEDRE